MRAFWTRRGFDNAAGTSLAITLLIIVAVGALSRFTIRRFLNNDAQIARSYALRDSLNAVLTDLLDAETGQRGYLLTGSPSYLGPYDAGARAVGSDLARLRGASKGDDFQQDGAAQLTAVAGQKLKELDLTLDLDRRHGRAAAISAVNSGLGRNLMEQARSIAASMQQRESRRLAAHTLFAESSGVQARNWIVVATCIASAFTVMTLLIVSRYLNQRKTAETENQRLTDAAEDAAERQRVFLRDVLSSVTEGRLRLCESPEELPEKEHSICAPIGLSLEGGLGTLRAHAIEAARLCGISEERAYDLITSASEAGMNAISHAGGGDAQVCTDYRDRVQVWIEDHGAGITLDKLPHATLERGFSTGGSLGHGFYMMLQMVDRVYLLTGPTGTIVVLEQYREPLPASWIEAQMAGFGQPPELEAAEAPAR